MPSPPSTPTICPICRTAPTIPFSTPCHHIYCYDCITTHLSKTPTCPLCHVYLTLPSLTAHPAAETHHTMPATPAATPPLTAAVSSRRAEPPPIRRSGAAASERSGRRRPDLPMPNTPSAAMDNPQDSALMQVSTLPAPDVLLKVGDGMTATQLAAVIERLSQKLHEKEGGERRLEVDLLLSFLKRTRDDKRQLIDRLQQELNMLEADVGSTEIQRAAIGGDIPPVETSSASSTRDQNVSMRSGGEIRKKKMGTVLANKRRRMLTNYNVLHKRYFEAVASHTGERRNHSLRSFTDDIYKLTQYSTFRDRATLMHVARLPETSGVDVFKTSNIVSSIEFDRESEFVATAGVTRRIKIFEFSNITRNLTDVHYPVREIPTLAKLSWVCWNPYIRHHLVSSDYEGFVTLWDVSRGTALREYEEHEDRAWSVDYCPSKPTYFASGSDDGRVKLWTTSQRGSVLTIDNKPANVCSVKFHPTAGEKLAFGSVDYNVHYYDLRNTKQALNVFKSHSKAVSYVKFMSPTQLVSASVDSTIKLWDLSTMTLERTFTGHVNDKNFVGLSVTEDYIACGSEQNSVYCYYKAIPKPFTGYRFSSVDPLTGQEQHDDDASQFVSSVCWCPNNKSMLVAANSLGAMKVLQLDAGDEDEDQDADGESQVQAKMRKQEDEIESL